MTVVDRSMVAEYYIECELDNIVVGSNIQLKNDHYHSNTQRLLEALSFTYRANGVFDYVYGGQFRWEKREVAVDDIQLGGMGEYLTDIIYSKEIGQNPRKFVEYVKRHPEDERLHQLKPSVVPKNRQTILLRETQGGLKMLDGSHRFLSMIMGGADRVRAYVAVPVGTDEKPMIGDAIFLRLRKLWQQTDDVAFQRSIVSTVEGMIRASSDGKQAVKAYWVSMAPNEAVKSVGRQILETVEK
jgi:hypothetical protein